MQYSGFLLYLKIYYLIEWAKLRDTRYSKAIVANWSISYAALPC